MLPEKWEFLVLILFPYTILVNSGYHNCKLTFTWKAKYIRPPLYTENIQTAIDALEKQKVILCATPRIQNISVPADSHLSIAKMALDALIAKQEQILLLIQINELTTENEAIKELYETDKSKRVR